MTTEPHVLLMDEPATDPAVGHHALPDRDTATSDLAVLTDDELDALRGSVIREQARRDPDFTPEFVARRVAEVVANEAHPNAVRLRELDDALAAAVQAADDLLDGGHPIGCPCRLCGRSYGRELRRAVRAVAGSLGIFREALASYC